MNRVRSILIRDKSEAYYAWVIAAFSPWATVPARKPAKANAKPNPPRVAEVARDSLRADNKTVTILSDAVTHSGTITDVKGSFLAGNLPGTDREIRQQIGLHIRSWKKDWRLCILLSILLEIMKGGEFSTGKRVAFPEVSGVFAADSLTLKVIHDYDKFLSYIKDQGLLEAYELKPIVNGDEIMKALGLSKGPWMGKALDIVIRWQLQHPEISEKEKALEELKSRRDELEIKPAKSK